MKHTVVIFFILVVLECLLYLLTPRKELFSEQSQRASVYDSIAQSPFFSKTKMKPIDCIARHTNSPLDYTKTYMSALKGFTPYETNLLTEYITRIRKIDAVQATRYFKTIPWNIVNIDGTIELGYPHTHANIIVLTSEFLTQGASAVQETLIHEQLHVFQRLFPKQTHAYVTNVLECTDVTELVANDKIFQEVYTMSRNNPDIDRVYAWRNRWIPMQIYTSLKPNDISESSVKMYDMENKRVVPYETSYDKFLPDFVRQTEHPYEIMAVICAKMLYNNYKNDINDITSDIQSSVLEKTRAWMQQHL